jgi:hypothetical protein
MDRRKTRLLVLVVPLALVLLASFLAAQGPPNPCVNVCWQTYTESVRACHGDAACLAAARAAALACVQGCGVPKNVQQQGPTSKVVSR